MAVLEVTGIVRPTSTTNSRSVVGFRVDASVTRSAAITPADPEMIDLVGTGSGVVDANGDFKLGIGGEGDPRAPIRLTVSTPEGVRAGAFEFTLEQVAKPLTLRVQGLPPLDIVPADDPAKGGRVTLTGRVIDELAKTVPPGLPVVLWGVGADNPTPQPVVVTQTQAGGFFSANWVSTTLVSAFGRVAGSAPVPIALDDAERLPRRVLLVLDVPADEGGINRPVLAATGADLTGNPAGFSQDLGRGCVDLTTPNRVLEEFVYTFVVRTSEPDVKGVTFGERRLVPPHLFTGLFEASALHEAFTVGRASTVRAADLKDLALDVDSARELVRGDDPPTFADIKRAAWLSEIGWLKDLIGGVVSAAPVRQPLDAGHPIDWDDTPTVYEAITIARGHILEFREVWRANGYSLGDLLHSLPLAPGQRRRVAVVDWERRSTTTREEALEFEEELNAFTGRDRDVSEIVGSRLHEEEAAGSHNTTWGVAGGIGAGFIGSGFGIFGGVAGSHGGSESSAWQQGSRSFAGDSLQSLRDRVMQRSSAVRDQRSTVVQTAAQGETLRAETEVVANYNHCHAMTVEYFEVLRHFLITHELSDVRECLFVPLPIREFDRGKALRWQTPLTGRLTDRTLLPGFDATRRIADNWDGWDYPVSRYSEEAPEVLEGELRIQFVLPRPRDAADGGFQLDAWAPYTQWLWGSPFEIWTQWIQEGLAEINAENIARRDRQFRERIAPEIAKRVVERLRFWYVTDDGGEIEVPLDATLVSRYAEGTPLYVTLRPRGALPAVAREKVSQFKITLDTRFFPPFNIPLKVLPQDAQVIVTSGKVRYRTEHKQFVLFSDSRILNDLSESDAVFIPTPTSWEERRNPREEDRRLADRLVAHLNNALEYYHQVIWMWLDAERRFMLLDGILVPGLGGKSVASVVENSVIGIAGNSMIFPLAPGVRIDPRVNSESEGDLRDLYAVDAPPAIRVSMPTRGVYAEAILGDCNGCEPIDDSRYWRWTDDGMLAPPTIEPIDTGTRAEGEEALTPTPLPKPLVSIQNAPELPAPVGLGDVFKVLAKPDLFADITGLEGTQKNARAAFDSALSAASAVATQAAGLAKQNMASTDGERTLDRIAHAQTDGLLTPGTAQELSQKVLGSMVGKPDAPSDKKADSPASDPDVQKAIEKASQSDNASIKVSTPDESLDLSFDGGDSKVGGGGAPTIGVLDVDGFVDEQVIRETSSGAAGAYVITKTTFATLADLKAAYPAKVAAIQPKFLRANPADSTKYQLFRRLRIAYPADPKDAKKVAGSGRLPLAVLVHGQHLSWQGGGEIRNHDGYAFLQDYLATRGVASVSVDTNAANFFGSLVDMRANMVLGAIDALKAMDKDATSRFHNRFDFDRIGLMGHSRGGDAVVQAARFNAGNKHGVIKAVASLAPTDFTGTLVDGSKRNVMDAATAGFYFVLYGGLDGDVSGYGGASGFVGTGFRHYDRATAEKAMVYIPFCCHNRFNDTWSADDDGLIPTDIARLHSRADHRKLLCEYVGGLFEWKLLGANGKAMFFNARGSNSLGHDVSQQWLFGSQRKQVDDFEAAGAIGARTTKSAAVSPFADVQVNAKKLEPNTSHQTSILAIEANLVAPTPTAYELDVTAGQRDWAGYEMLSLRFGVWVDIDTQAKINSGSGLPPFELVLIDGAGGSAKVDAVSMTTPDIPGKPVFHQVNIADPGDPPDIQNYSLHRLVTTAVTLAPLGIKLDDVRKLQIVPGAAFKQKIFFDSFWLVTL